MVPAAAIIRHMLRDETEERSPTRVGLWRRLDSPGWAAALTAAVVLVFVLARLAANGGDLSAFVVAGDRFVDPRAAPDELTVRQDSSGYDGAFVYRLALDPFTDQQVAHGITLDNPPYRQQRIVLPLVAWLTDAATPLPLPLILILVNALALVGAGWFGARFAMAYGRHAGLGVLLAISPGLLIGLARDLNEPLAWLGLLAGLWWWREGRHPLAVAAFSVSALTRETTLMVVAGLGLWQLVALTRGGREELGRRLPRFLWLLVPLASELAWQGWLYRVWGRLPVLSGEGNIGVPPFRVAASLLDHDASWLDTGKDALLSHLWLAQRLWLLAFLGLVAWSLPRARLPRGMRLGWVLALLLALAPAWERDVQFFRAATEAIGVGLLVLLARRDARLGLPLAGIVAMVAVVAVVHALGL
jgi:hypothetical protein